MKPGDKVQLDGFEGEVFEIMESDERTGKNNYHAKQGNKEYCIGPKRAVRKIEQSAS